ncbi:hypothetical protein [Galbibacter mesophilus]|uniref:hypothetical protein n=1 Tax=Galbibacter mesophilus TaxID=379069 RepID=UPI00191E0070|nr:hypothetical protein [Galbibacter mesophilus]MCM5663178.1 hypothetical protein [Galbibacter mesophilus]
MKRVDKQISESKSFVQNRRAFLKTGAIATSGMLLPRFMWASGAFDTSVVSSSSGIYVTPTILLHKTAVLVAGSDFIGSDIQRALASDINNLAPGNAFFSGLHMPFSQKDKLAALQRLKEKVTLGTMSKQESERLAVILGGLAGTAALDVLKEEGSQEQQIAHDAALLDIFYSKGKKASSKDDEEVASLFKEITPRTFTRFHTIKPDEKLGPEWVLRMQSYRESTDEYYNSLAKKFVEFNGNLNAYPSPFITPGDTILVKVSTLSDIDEIDRKEANGLVQNNTSIAGKALAKSYNAIIGVNDFWRGALTIDELEMKLK